MKAGLEILSKLTNNIVQNPREEKFKMIKTTNKTIMEKVMTLQPPAKLMELLEFLGYVQMPADPSIWMFTGEEYVILKRGNHFINEAIEKVKQIQPMTEEDQERALKNKLEREKIKQKMEEEKKFKEQLHEIIKQDRKDFKEDRQLEKERKHAAEEAKKEEEQNEAKI